MAFAHSDHHNDNRFMRSAGAHAYSYADTSFHAYPYPNPNFRSYVHSYRAIRCCTGGSKRRG